MSNLGVFCDLRVAVVIARIVVRVTFSAVASMRLVVSRMAIRSCAVAVTTGCTVPTTAVEMERFSSGN